jgi:DNA damage-binding protein 1
MRNFLLTIQQNIANRVESPGDISFNDYRAFKTDVRTSREPYRVVDGELVERFLNLSDDVQKVAIEGVSLDGKQVTVEQTRSIIETLRRLH